MATGFFFDIVRDIRTHSVIPNVAVYIYLHGTPTLATLYDTNGNEVSNPVASSSFGHATAFIDPGFYDIKYVVAGYQDYWRTNVLISSATINAIRTTTAPADTLSYPQDVILLCDCTGNAIAITLPDITTIPAGYSLGIKKIDDTANIVTITDPTALTINGASSVTLEIINEGIWVAHDGTAWQIVGRM